MGSSVSCACGQRLSGEASVETLLLVDAETLGILEESAERGPYGRVESWADVWLIKDGPRVYLCSNCGQVVVEGLGPGPRRYFREVDPAPRIWVDPYDRDALGRIRLRHERTLAELRGSKYMLEPGVELIGVWEGGELRGRMQFAAEDAETDFAGGPSAPGWSLEPDA